MIKDLFADQMAAARQQPNDEEAAQAFNRLIHPCLPPKTYGRQGAAAEQSAWRLFAVTVYAMAPELFDNCNPATMAKSLGCSVSEVTEVLDALGTRGREGDLGRANRLAPR